VCGFFDDCVCVCVMMMGEKCVDILMSLCMR